MVFGKITALFGKNKNTNVGEVVAGRDVHIGDITSNDTQLFMLSQAGYIDGLRQSKQQLSQQIQIFSSMPVKDERTLHVLSVALRQVGEKLADTEAAYELAQQEGNQLAKVLVKMNEQKPNDKTIAAIKALGNDGNNRQADRILDAAIQQDEASAAEKYYWRGKIAASHFDLNKKREFLRKAVELDPKNMVYLEAVAEVEMDFDLKKAVLYTQRLVSIMRGVYGEQPLLLADKLSTHAHNLENIGHYSEAIVLAEESTVLLRAEYGDNNLKIADSLHHQAKLYRLQGRLNDAESLFREELKLIRLYSEKSNYLLASALNSLAVVLNAQGCYLGTEVLYLEALEVCQKIHGERHSSVADILNNLAGLYESQGRYDSAEPLYTQAISIQSEVLGEKHPDFAFFLNDLAYLYRSQGRDNKAEPLFEKALSIRREVLGEQHPDLALSLNNLAYLYRSQGRDSKAKSLFEQALSIRRNVLGEQHPDTKSTANSLRDLRKKLARK